MMKNYKDNTVLLNDIKLGINSALEYLYKNNFSNVKKRILIEGGCEEDAKDCFQKSIISFYEKVTNNNSFLVPNIHGYIITAAINIWRKYLRDKGKIIVLVDIPVDIPDIQYHSETELVSDIVKLMSEISKTCYELLKLSIYEGFSSKKIATQLGYESEETVRASKSRCLKNFRNLVKTKLPQNYG